jgi:hypothetical protein
MSERGDAYPINPSPTIIDRIASWTGLSWAWFIVVGGLIPLTLILVGVTLDGVWPVFFSEGFWRLLVQPVMVFYILLIYPFMQRMEHRVVMGFRPAVLLDDEDYAQVVQKATAVNPRVEFLIVGIAALVGFWANVPWMGAAGFFWLRWALALSGALTLGLLGWVVFAAIAGTRLVTALHNLPLQVDLFDIKPFEPFGRQSIVMVLAFVGGVTLSTFFLISPDSGFLSIENLIFDAALILVAVLAFFLNMRPTHRVLAAAKRKELALVERNIARTYERLKQAPTGVEAAQATAEELNAWIAMEKRLEETRTWPYNTSMLRVLFLSVLIPVGAELIKVVYEVMLSQMGG